MHVARARNIGQLADCRPCGRDTGAAQPSTGRSGRGVDCRHGVAYLRGMDELESKLSAVRAALAEAGLTAVRLRGVDWFAWATCGGSAVVVLTAEVGVAEVLITADEAVVLTDEIEAARLADEQLPPGLRVHADPWAELEGREKFVRAMAGDRVASDRPEPGEAPLPEGLWRARRSLLPQELERYRTLGREAAEAATDVLQAARREWTGWQLAGTASEALWRRGIEPTLTLVGDERRLPRYRHATAARDRLGARAMLVLCARRHGLFANLTRFVYFRPPTADERRLALDVARVEAAALAASRPGATHAEVLAAIVRAYADAGHPGAERKHHQGGSCGYLSRDVVARPGIDVPLQLHGAVAWNPSLPGAKIEDTFVIGERGVENLTLDPRWPAFEHAGRARPDLLVR